MAKQRNFWLRTYFGFSNVGMYASFSTFEELQQAIVYCESISAWCSDFSYSRGRDTELRQVPSSVLLEYLETFGDVYSRSAYYTYNNTAPDE